jgi:hypothetical protein
MFTAPLFGTSTSHAADISFTDMKPGSEGYESVINLASLNIIKGYADGHFAPFENISRQHVAVMLTKALNLPIPDDITSVLSTYKDVKPGDQYAKQIAAVTKAGIFKGANGYFNPNMNISRDQVATVIVKAFNLTDIGADVNLVDLNSISPSHRENVKILAQHGITIGKVNEKGERYFDGAASIARVQFAIFLDKAMQTNNVTFSFSGFDNIVAGTEAPFSITAKAVNVSADQKVRYKAVLVDSNNKPVANQKIKYEAAKDTWLSFTTDENGVAYFGPEKGFTTADVDLANGVTSNFKTILADAGKYTLTLQLVDAASDAGIGTAATKTFEVKAPTASVDFTFSGFDTFKAGQPNPFSISVKAANIPSDEKLRYKATLTDKDGNPVANQVIGYQVAEDKWMRFSTDDKGVAYFGPETGFTTSDVDLANGVTTNFTATVAAAGDYILTVELVDVDTNATIDAPATQAFTVAE